MDQARRKQILQKTAGLFGPSDAVVSAQKNFAAGGTLDQRMVNDQGGSLPASTTLSDRIKLWHEYGGEQRAPWKKYERVSAMYEPPASTGYSLADKGLESLRRNQGRPFDLVHPGENRAPKAGSLDCSGFARTVVGQPGGTDWIVNDAKGAHTKFRQIPHNNMQPGDYLVFPGTTSKDADGKPHKAFGHVGMYAGNGKIIDQSSSGHGTRFRTPPLEFATNPTIVARPNMPNRRIGPGFDPAALKRVEFPESQLPSEETIAAYSGAPQEKSRFQRFKDWAVSRM